MPRPPKAPDRRLRPRIPPRTFGRTAYAEPSRPRGSSTGRRTRRHTYASFSIAAGVSLFALARRMGTSVQRIDKTYGHLLPDAVEYERGLLDAFDARQEEAAGDGQR
jgi:hypothetical protein